MYLKIWTMQQVDDIYNTYIKDRDNIPTKFSLEAVIPTIKEQISILDQFYGIDRNPDTDGGWLALILEPITREDKEYKDLLEKYHIESSEYAEIIEDITEDENYFYRMEVFIMTEFALILIYPCIKNMEENRID